MAQQAIYFGRFVDTPKLDDIRIRTGALLVSCQDRRGVISKADWTVTSPSEAASRLGVEVPVITSKENGFFFPGFIDTHIHASQYPNAGIFGKSTLLDWLTTYTFPLESSLGNAASPLYANSTTPVDPLSRAKAVYNRVVSATLAHGTTTASYYATISVPATNTLSKTAFEKGQRAYVGRLLAPIVTPRFAPSCLASTLTALGQLAKEKDLRIQTHLAENVDEMKLVKELFPEQASYTEVYDTHQLLTPKTILAHSIHLDASEIQTIKVRQSKISHCPASNSALGSGFCPVRVYLDSGLDVGLGTDVSGGYSPSILEAVRQACLVSRHVGYIHGGDSRHSLSVNDALYLGTVGGAKVVGMEGKLGAFEEGMLWDVQEIDLGDLNDEGEQLGDSGVDIFGWESWENKVAKWVWGGDDRNVKRVWVSGKLVHERNQA
ncbi:hypothetical protein DV736_g2960, partial [Chaetothyriales sp. CBS 134916]